MSKFRYEIEIEAEDENTAYWSMVKALKAANVKFEGIKVK